MDAVNETPVLSLHDVGFFYPDHPRLFRRSEEKSWALRKLNFTIYEGEVVGVVGRNGAGKSTLLKLLAGITVPDTGRLESRPDLRRTLLSIQAGFDMQLTGRDNAILSGMLLGIRRKVLLEKLGAIAELAGLGEAMNEPLRTYSTGMRARLGFATAYHTDPDIMLLDEVFSVGDVAFASSALALMEERIRSRRTAILVSHSEKLMKDLCQRLIWIDQGEVRADGDPDSVWHDYRSSFPEGIKGAGR